MDCDELFDEARGSLLRRHNPARGPGTYEHIGFEPLLKALKDQHDAGRALWRPICAAPLLLEEAGILEGRKCTAHTSVIGKLKTATPPRRRDRRKRDNIARRGHGG